MKLSYIEWFSIPIYDHKCKKLNQNHCKICRQNENTKQKIEKIFVIFQFSSNLPYNGSLGSSFCNNFLFISQQFFNYWSIKFMIPTNTISRWDFLYWNYRWIFILCCFSYSMYRKTVSVSLFFTICMLIFHVSFCCCWYQTVDVLFSHVLIRCCMMKILWCAYNHQLPVTGYESFTSLFSVIFFISLFRLEFIHLHWRKNITVCKYLDFHHRDGGNCVC